MKKEKLTIKSSTQPNSSSQVQPENISQQTSQQFTKPTMNWRNPTKNSSNISKTTGSKSSIPSISRKLSMLTKNSTNNWSISYGKTTSETMTSSITSQISLTKCNILHSTTITTYQKPRSQSGISKTLSKVSITNTQIRMNYFWINAHSIIPN